MQKNDIIELRIEDIGVNGEGIGKYDGMTFFVKDAVIGDVLSARITKLKKNYGYARAESVIAPSLHRVIPQCEQYRRCGGCQLQVLDYAAQLAFKTKKIRDDFIRIGKFLPELIDDVMQPIVGMETPFRYRNKAQFPIGRNKEGEITAGFYAARTHEIVPVMDCKLGVSGNQSVLKAVLDYMKENKVEAYDETTRKGLIRHVLIRYGFATGEWLVCLVINGTRLKRQECLIEKLTAIKGMTSISVNKNTENTNVILGDVTETIWGQAYITDHIHMRQCSNADLPNAGRDKEAAEKDEFALTDRTVAFHISPQSFYQVNPVQTEKLYSLALEYAALTGEETVWDLYCGIGTISLFLAPYAKKVYGVESVAQAVEDAKSNAKLNGITNAEFFAGNVEEVLPAFYERGNRTTVKDAGSGEDMLHPDVIVVDPPRKGCDEKCLETMIKMRPERIVYVSCDPATLARDLRVLCDGGYELKKVRGVDQFGNTVHVECVVLMSRIEK